MPITSSAKKALRQSGRRHIMNLDRKKKMGDTLKKFRKMIAAGKTAEAAKYLPEVYKTLDKMKKVGFIKPNKADRLKSRLSKKLPKK
ncbi:MAG: 30S ribosomal protein S20 [Patescibacteria group bacterium]